MHSDGMLAEPAAPRQSGAQRFFARALYVFFARPFVFLIPALAITAFGAYSATSEPDQYRSVGALNVSSDTFLGQLSEVRSSDFNFQTPATSVAGQFNELMQTDGFALDVVAGAGLTDAVQGGLLTLADVRADVYALAGGDSLLRVIALSEIPERAQQLAVSALGTYRNYVLDSEVDEQTNAESVYNDQVSIYKTQVDAAFAAYTDYLEQHPAPVDSRDQRDIGEQSEIQRLTDSLARAQTRLDGALDNRESARLATVISGDDIDQRLKIIDQPSLPVAPDSGLKAVLTKVILFGMVGLMVSLGAIALASLLDRSIHSAADLESFGARVRAVVPQSKGMRVEPRHLRPVATKVPAPMRSAG